MIFRWRVKEGMYLKVHKLLALWISSAVQGEYKTKFMHCLIISITLVVKIFEASLEQLTSKKVPHRKWKTKNVNAWIMYK